MQKQLSRKPAPVKESKSRKRHFFLPNYYPFNFSYFAFFVFCCIFKPHLMRIAHACMCEHVRWSLGRWVKCRRQKGQSQKALQLEVRARRTPRLPLFSFFKFAEECEMVELGKLLQLRESVAVKEWKRRLRHFFRAPIISHFLFILARIHPPESRGVSRGRHVLQIQPAHDFWEETLGGQLDNMICIWSFRIWRTRGGRYNIGVIWSKFNQSGD